MGQSQAAFALTSFVNGVQPLTRAFDGFLLHSRGAEGLPVRGDVAVDAEAAATVDEAEAAATADEADGVILRTDTEVPVIVLQSETDVGLLGSARARQPDTDTIRTWEVAGTAHADRRVLSQEIAASLGCPGEVNDGPMHVVAKAALRRLVEWVQDGSSAPGAEPLALTGDDGDTGGRDDLGIALGGVRTPPVDVPTRVLSGEPPEGASLICSLSGSTTPIAEADLADRYGSRADFEAQYAAALDDAIEAGFVLEEDRAAIEDYAHPELVPE